MTIITKTRLVIAVLAAVLVGAGAAVAGDNDNPFTDVPDVGAADEAFYSAPVEWLWDNALTTGSPSGSDTFKPLDNVTRGEYATFNFRYDQNVVQPALETVQTELDSLVTVVGYATVLADGTVVEAQSMGVTGANVTLEVVSAFCFRDLPFEFGHVQVSPVYDGTADAATIEVGREGAGFGTDDCEGEDAVLVVATQTDSAFDPRAFTIAFFG